MNFFFRESGITCIITVVGAQKQHKGMFFLKHGGGGCKIFQQCHGGRFFSGVFARGGGGAQFCPPPPAINNEHSLIEVKSDSHMISRR